MAFGRSYNVIRWLQESFSYTMLVTIIMNPHLPDAIRAAGCTLVGVLYLDRYPQVRRMTERTAPTTSPQSPHSFRCAHLFAHLLVLTCALSSQTAAVRRFPRLSGCMRWCARTW